MKPQTVSVRQATDDFDEIEWICPDGDPNQVWSDTQPRCQTCGELMVPAQHCARR